MQFRPMWYPFYAEVDVVKIGRTHATRAKPWEEEPSDATTQCRDLTRPLVGSRCRDPELSGYLEKGEH
jgi:hypothetical protein